MKVNIVKQQILNNYKKLSQSITVPKPERNIITVWSLSYKQNGINGFVSQLGRIQREGSALDIIDGQQLKIIKKPFFKSKEGILNNINEMLEGIIANLENKEIVDKSFLKILEIPRLSKLQ